MNVEEAGQRIRSRRKELGISQRDLSQIAEVSLHTVSDIESGKGNPTLSILVRLLDPLGLELAIGVRGPRR